MSLVIRPAYMLFKAVPHDPILSADNVGHVSAPLTQGRLLLDSVGHVSRPLATCVRDIVEQFKGCRNQKVKSHWSI